MKKKAQVTYGEPRIVRKRRRELREVDWELPVRFEHPSPAIYMGDTVEMTVHVRLSSLPPWAMSDENRLVRIVGAVMLLEASEIQEEEENGAQA